MMKRFIARSRSLVFNPRIRSNASFVSHGYSTTNDVGNQTPSTLPADKDKHLVTSSMGVRPRRHLSDTPEDLGAPEDFDIEKIIDKQDKEMREAKLPSHMMSSPIVKPSLSQAYKERYQKNPYKVDKHGQAVWDFSKLESFSPSRYPGIERDPLIFMKKPRYPYQVKTIDQVNKSTGKFEFRHGVSSMELLQAGITPTTNTTPLQQTVPAATTSEGKDSSTDMDTTSLVAKIFSWDNASQEQLNKKKIQVAVNRFQLHLSDTGSTPVQVAVLTQKIQIMAEHLKSHHKDIRTARKLQLFTQRRKRLLQYLRRTDGELYWKTVHALDLRVTL